LNINGLSVFISKKLVLTAPAPVIYRTRDQEIFDGISCGSSKIDLYHTFSDSPVHRTRDLINSIFSVSPVSSTPIPSMRVNNEAIKNLGTPGSRGPKNRHLAREAQ